MTIWFFIHCISRGTTKMYSRVGVCENSWCEVVAGFCVKMWAWEEGMLALREKCNGEQNPSPVVTHHFRSSHGNISLTDLGNPVTQSLILTQIFLTQESERGEDARGGTEEKNEERVRCKSVPGGRLARSDLHTPRLGIKYSLPVQRLGLPQTR